MAANPLPAGESFTQDVACTPTLAFGGGALLEVDVPYFDPDTVFQFYAVTAIGGALATSSVDFTGEVQSRSAALQPRGPSSTTRVSIASSWSRSAARIRSSQGRWSTAACR